MIDRQIRAFDAWPTAYSVYRGQALRFFAAQALTQTSAAPAGTVVAETRAGIDIVAGDGYLVRILELQMAGSKRLAVADFLNARSLLGEYFSKVSV